MAIDAGDVGERVDWIIWEPPPWYWTELYDPADHTGETVTSYSLGNLGSIAVEAQRPDPPKTGSVVGDYHAAELLSALGELR